MFNKQSKAPRLKEPCLSADTIKPINYERLSIRELCLLEALAEESEKAHREGRTGATTVTHEQVKAKIVEKKRERKKTGKISTFLKPGQFMTGDAIIEDGTKKRNKKGALMYRRSDNQIRAFGSYS
jgi:hypothetical protein